MAKRNLSLFIRHAFIGCLAGALLSLLPLWVNAQEKQVPVKDLIEASIKEVMEKSHVPGASIIIINGGEVEIKNYGYADIEKKIPFTDDTLFEIGSCSKSLTALGIIRLANDGMLNLSDPVSKFFPGFKMVFRGEEYDITINQLLHHTSGIAPNSFAKIPPGNSPHALSDVIDMLSGKKLVNIPGREFNYSNTNFDVAGAIIEVASGMPYEKYMESKIFTPLGMHATSVSFPKEGYPMATGYKMAFGEPEPYDAPRFRGNSPAGYIITNAKDMVTYFKIQMGVTENELSPAIRTSHYVDQLLQGENRFRPTLYTNGWFSDNAGSIFHGGQNPNFSAEIYIDPNQQMAVAVFTNYSTPAINSFLTGKIVGLLKGVITPETKFPAYEPPRDEDGPFSMVTYAVGGLLCLVIGFILYIFIDVLRKVRHYSGFSLIKLGKMGIAFGGTIPFLMAVYFIPGALRDFSWDMAFIWGPGSLTRAIPLLIVFLAAVNLLFALSLLFPYKDQESFKNKYVKPLPMILFLGMVGGLASSGAMFLISTSIIPRFIKLEVNYLVLYIGLFMIISVFTQKIVQTKMNYITNDIVYGLRMRLIRKIFATRFQRFEKIESGRVYATLNNDTDAISGSAGMVVGIITNVVTAVAAFFYLSAISMMATLATLGFGVILGIFYIIVGKKARVLMEEMRDTQNKFMSLIEGLVKGFREISLHHNKKIEYEADVEESCAKYRDKRVFAVIKLINAGIISGSAMTLLMAGVCITFPRIFPDMDLGRLISFIMILMWMLGPVMSIMSSIPAFIRIKVSWDRIQKFIAEIPAIEELMNYREIKALSHKGEIVDTLETQDVYFSYPSEGEKQGFSVGPINIKIQKGEILFVVGGNGSGKTTLAKLITGLYAPEKGKILINGNEIKGQDYLGEYFSVIFGDYQLFAKLYNVDIEPNREKIRVSLELLDLKGKVDIKDGSFTTIDLSGGQRKRLALLQCWLENCPIYLFDEVAADQDPEFRKFFYRDLLPRMKAENKIVICITHDDHYFDVADQIIKMDMGKIDSHVFPALSSTTEINTTGAMVETA